MCEGEPAPIQTVPCWSTVRSSRTAIDRRQRERGHGARLETGRGDDLPCMSDANLGGTDRCRDLQRVRPPVAGHEREHVGPVADEDERLDDLLEPAADRPRRRLRGRRPVGELLDRRVDRAGSKAARRPARPARATWRMP